MVPMLTHGSVLMGLSFAFGRDGSLMERECLVILYYGNTTAVHQWAHGMDMALGSPLGFDICLHLHVRENPRQGDSGYKAL